MKFRFRKKDRNNTNRPRSLSADEVMANSMAYYQPSAQQTGCFMPNQAYSQSYPQMPMYNQPSMAGCAGLACGPYQTPMSNQTNQMYGGQYQMPMAQSYQANPGQLPTLDPSALPPVNSSCWSQSNSFPPGVSRSYHVQDPPEQRVLSTTDADVQTFVRDNNNNIIHHKTLVTQLNRHHIHTQRVLTNENYLHTFLIHNLLKVNDIHHPRIEYVPGTSRVLYDYKQAYSTEPARCIRAM